MLLTPTVVAHLPDTTFDAAAPFKIYLNTYSLDQTHLAPAVTHARIYLLFFGR